MAMEGPDHGLIAGQVPVLRSGRLLLRPLRDDDGPRIQTLVDDIEVARWMGRIPHPYTVADASFFIESIAPTELGWGIDVPGTGLIGVGGFAFRAGSPEIELGYWLGRAYWGRGFATEAARAMLSHAWSQGASRVVSGCFDGNDRSRHVLEKCGFRVVGRSLRSNLARGADLPHTDMAVERPRETDARVG